MSKEHIRLKALRTKNRFTQQDMAQMLNISYSTYSMKENGNRDFTISEIEKIRDLFGLSYEQIFFDDNAHDTKTHSA